MQPKHKRVQPDIDFIKTKFYEITFFKNQLKVFDKQCFDYLFYCMKYKKIEADQVLFKPNDEPDYIYIILNGFVTQTRESKITNNFTKELSSGDVIGDNDIMLK